MLGFVRAGRLLTMLLLLREQGRTTTADLAAKLEVSRRTVLRDLAALGEAGVPLVTFAGTGGGVELLAGWSAAVEHLAGEPGPGLLAGQPLLAHALGVPALPDGPGESAAGRWLTVDPEPAAGHAVDAGLLKDAARACREGLALAVTTGRRTRVLRPERLVLRAGRWWLAEAETELGGAAGLVAPDLVRSHRLRPPRDG